MHTDSNMQILLCYSAIGLCAPVQGILCIVVLPSAPAQAQSPAHSVVSKAIHLPLPRSTIRREQDPQCTLFMVSATSWKVEEPLKVMVVIGSQVTHDMEDLLTTPSGRTLSQAISDGQPTIWAPPKSVLDTKGPFE